MDDQHIDGNGVAGLLSEIAGAEMTEVLWTCQSCHHRWAVGELVAYRSAGVVLRCPSCPDVAIVVGMQDTRLLFAWHGIYEIRR